MIVQRWRSGLHNVVSVCWNHGEVLGGEVLDTHRIDGIHPHDPMTQSISGCPEIEDFVDFGVVGCRPASMVGASAEAIVRRSILGCPEIEVFREEVQVVVSEVAFLVEGDRGDAEDVGLDGLGQV